MTIRETHELAPPAVSRITRTDRDAASRVAFAALVALHHGRLDRLAHLLCGDAAQAEDAVADAYAKVWRRFRSGAVDDPAAYLRQAVVNQVRGGYRRRALERREEQRQRVDWRDGVSPHRNVEDRNLLEPALRELPVTQRAVIVLRFFEDLSEEQIARVLDIPVGTVKSRCARGLAQLRASIGSNDE